MSSSPQPRSPSPSSERTVSLDQPPPPKDAMNDVQQKEEANDQATMNDTDAAMVEQGRYGTRFWLIMLALGASTFLSALDLTAVSTALPQISEDLHATDYVWVGSAYALTSTAWLPWTGSLATIFGRRSLLLSSLALFAAGSAVSGAAQSMAMMIAGRSVQGLGGGGILSMVEMVVCDLVPLRDRGQFMGAIGAVWAISSAIGPPIGGVFADANWRWLFYMNLPICGAAAILVILFMDLKIVEVGTTREKIRRMDISGNLLFIAATTSTILALTWGGVTYPWKSYKVLVPLVLGVVGMIAYFFLERYVVKYPTVDVKELANKTTLLGYAGVFTHAVVVMAVVYYMPIYFQAVKGAGTISSGVDLFPISFTVAPAAIINGIITTITGIYKPQNLVAWAVATLGLGLMSMLKTDTSTGAWVGYTLVVGIGTGILYSANPMIVTAPLKPELHAKAMATHAFLRSFGQVFGVTIGSTVLQNQLVDKLPLEFINRFPDGAQIAYASIPIIKNLEEPLRTQVRHAFTDSLRLLWYICIPICGISLIFTAFVGVYNLAVVTDENWGMADQKDKRASAAPSAKTLEEGHSHFRESASK